MTYTFVLLAALGAFIWFTPARQEAAKLLDKAGSAIRSATESRQVPFSGFLDKLRDRAASKSKELLREQLHKAVDEATD